MSKIDYFKYDKECCDVFERKIFCDECGEDVSKLDADDFAIMSINKNSVVKNIYQIYFCKDCFRKELKKIEDRLNEMR
jgi:hypothetical protein